MRKLLNLSLIILTALLLTNCNRVSKNKSTLTGWNFNDPKYGNYIKGNSFEGQRPPDGMVVIEGGTFTMGHVQDDVMFDWNTTPRKMHIRSFYMDEAEVTNSEYLLFVQNMKDVFPPEEEKYKHIYESVLPDTLVWRKSLGNTDLLSESYFRHPAYADYPVVGVSWLQANQYCKWRTNAVNLNLLIKGKYIENILANDTIRNFFDTELFLADANLLFKDSTIYKKGIPTRTIRKKGAPKPKKDAFKGRPITKSDGVLAEPFRLPTEAEWEYAAKSIVENREYNNIRGRKKYAWNGKYTRDRRKRYRGDQLANFRQSAGDYSGLPGWSSDGSDIPIKVKSYPPNGFGLYDMSGNVNEWVADVYRPIVDNEANDFNYFRGNIFKKRMINKNGKVVVLGTSDQPTIAYDTLPTGKIVPRELPGTIKYVPITQEDTYMRRNYNRADNSNLNDGDHNSSRYYNAEEDVFNRKGRMYNSPKKPEEERDSISGRINTKYDAKKRTTLISDKSRVYKGGSWFDRAYWLDPAQRRYLPEYMSSNDIGFRCVIDKVGPMTYKKRTPRAPKRK